MMVQTKRFKAEMSENEEFKIYLKNKLSNPEPFRPLDPELLEQWVQERASTKGKRHIRRSGWCKIMGAAAIVMLCLIGFCCAPLLMGSQNNFIAGNHEDTTSDVGDSSVVIKNNSQGESDNVGTEVITYKGDEGLNSAKERFSDLMVPGYVPEGYILEKLEVMCKDYIGEYKYFFIKGDYRLELVQTGDTGATIVYNNFEEIECIHGKAYITTDDVGLACTCKSGNTVLSMKCNCSKEEIVKILNNWK